MLWLPQLHPQLPQLEPPLRVHQLLLLLLLPLHWPLELHPLLLLPSGPLQQALAPLRLRLQVLPLRPLLLLAGPLHPPLVLPHPLLLHPLLLLLLTGHRPPMLHCVPLPRPQAPPPLLGELVWQGQQWLGPAARCPARRA